MHPELDNWTPVELSEVSADHVKVKRARDLKAQGLTPADIGKIIGASRATVYRYLKMGSKALV